MLHNLTEATNALLGFVPRQPLERHYKLDRVRAVLTFLGNPQEQVRVVHIAGTSGKTSTAYFIRGLLQAAGQRTGLTVSPHITAINERVQINGQPLPEAQFVAYLNEFLPLVAKTGLQPSYFELVIAFAYWVFAKEKVDYTVVETGLGGLLDATNTIKRPDKLCVFTDIGLDHTEILGDTVAKIATQKAGIIQPGNVAITNPQPQKIISVFANAAKKQRALLHIAPITTAAGLPPFQQRNWSLALAAYRLLDLPTLKTSQLKQVMTQTPPGRMEQYKVDNKTVILDGAHNPQKLQALHQALKLLGVTKTAVLANLTAAPDSKIDNAIATLSQFTSHLIVPEFSVGQDFNGRYSVPATTFAKHAKNAGMPSVVVEPNVATSLQLLLTRPEPVVVITGSLYLVSAVRPLLAKK